MKIFIAVLLFIAISTLGWGYCEYCKTIQGTSGSPFVLCSAVGTNQSCGRYYIQVQTSCCSDTPSSSCPDGSNPISRTFIYQQSTGTCTGAYYCSTHGTPCPGDAIVAVSHSCIPSGSLIYETGAAYDCAN